MTKVSFFISKILLVHNRNVYPTTKEFLPWKIQTSSLELISIPIQNPLGLHPSGFWIGIEISSWDSVWIFQGKNSLVVGFLQWKKLKNGLIILLNTYIVWKFGYTVKDESYISVKTSSKKLKYSLIKFKNGPTWEITNKNVL